MNFWFSFLANPRIILIRLKSKFQNQWIYNFSSWNFDNTKDSILIIFILAQVTFSENGTKVTSDQKIRNFGFLEILLWNQFHNAIDPLDWCGTLFWTQNILNQYNISTILILSEKSRISNFWIWVWGAIFFPFSKKVTCICKNKKAPKFNYPLQFSMNTTYKIVEKYGRNST